MDITLAVIANLVSNEKYRAGLRGGNTPVVRIPAWTPTKMRTWLRHYATSRKVAGSIPDEVIGFFN
jgi:hypothetical protein